MEFRYAFIGLVAHMAYGRCRLPFVWNKSISCDNLYAMLAAAGYYEHCYAFRYRCSFSPHCSSTYQIGLKWNRLIVRRRRLVAVREVLATYWRPAATTHVEKDVWGVLVELICGWSLWQLRAAVRSLKPTRNIGRLYKKPQVLAKPTCSADARSGCPKIKRCMGRLEEKLWMQKELMWG